MLLHSTVGRNGALSLENRKQEVYSSESYIHHHYRRDETSLFYPSDTQWNQPKPPHKGKRFVLFAQHATKETRKLVLCQIQSGSSVRMIHVVITTRTLMPTTVYKQWFKVKLLSNLNNP